MLLGRLLGLNDGTVLNEGRSDGIKLGTDDGNNEGSLLGYVDGIELGTSDGNDEGPLLGYVDGIELGSRDG